MILPSGASDFKEGVRIGAEIFHQLGEILKLDGYSCSVSDEGGFAPALSSNEKALALVVKAIAQAGYQPGKDVTLALDAAAPQLWVNGAYHLCDKENMAMTTEDLLEYYEYFMHA